MKDMFKHITMRAKPWAFVAASLITCSYAHAQQAAEMPTDAAMKQEMQKARLRASSALEQAMAEFGANAGQPRRMPEIDTQGMEGVDPAELAEKYQNMLAKVADSDVPKLVVFASLSMPEASLKKLSAQVRLAGGVMVFRGLKYGMKRWKESMEALKPVAEAGAEVQIHPEMFKRYNIQAVPTVVVTATAKAGCQDDTCAAQSAAVSGDVSLDYALKQLIDRKDEVGKIARDKLKRLRAG